MSGRHAGTVSHTKCDLAEQGAKLNGTEVEKNV